MSFTANAKGGAPANVSSAFAGCTVSPSVCNSKVVVCGWDLSHNAAGRAVTLIELYERAGAAEVSLVGCIFPKRSSELWAPLQGMPLQCDVIQVTNISRFFQEAEALVQRNPADIVHLSKPRLPNIVIGLLYKYLWGAKVVVDIDDEELSFVGAEQPFTGALADDECPGDLSGKLATQLSVGLAPYFDGITVSNPALQAVYGGEIIPHARDEKRYAPSLKRRIMNRELFGIPLDCKVVLFSGTPRKHKGIMDVALSLQALGRSDVLFVIVGDFPSSDPKEELKAVRGINLKFIPGQPYWHTPDVVSIADCVVLFQDVSSLSARYQTPAKLTDALAMGIRILAQITPALEDLYEAGGFIDVTRDNLTEKLAEALDKPVDSERSDARTLFLDRLSSAVVSTRLKAYVDGLDTNTLSARQPDQEKRFEPFRSTILDVGTNGKGRLARPFVDFLQQSAYSLITPKYRL